MIDVQTTNEIIKHRALGLSYSDIETTTGVSRPTVIKICRKHVNDIAEAREIASIIAYKDRATAISKRNGYGIKVFRSLWGVIGRNLVAMI